MDTLKQSLFLPIVRQAVRSCLVARDRAMFPTSQPLQLWESSIAHGLKAEILRAGKKLWERQYVDGNGGNISVRLSPQYVLCSPTLCSKGDLREEDLCLVDMENRLVIGTRRQTSEIRLHLEIYKTVPEAQAVIHCHPPYATAHAVAGVIPQDNLVPEQEVFVGPVALTHYETPGTPEFARTVVPLVKQHNTVLLGNHGIVCWADTVTHAEWYAEVLETYCKTLSIAKQLRDPLPEIPPDKIGDLLEIKKKLGLPDARLPQSLDSVLVQAKQPAIAASAPSPIEPPPVCENFDAEVERLAQEMTAILLSHLEGRARQ